MRQRRRLKKLLKEEAEALANAKGGEQVMNFKDVEMVQTADYITATSVFRQRRPKFFQRATSNSLFGQLYKVAYKNLTTVRFRSNILLL